MMMQGIELFHVHSAGLLEGLEQIYKTDRITKELRSGRISQ